MLTKGTILYETITSVEQSLLLR